MKIKRPLGIPTPALILLLSATFLMAGRSAGEAPGLHLVSPPLPRTLFTPEELSQLYPLRSEDGAPRPGLAPPSPDFASWRSTIEPRKPAPLSGVENALFTGTLVSLVGLNIADALAARKVARTLSPDELNPLTRAFAKSDLALAAFKIGSTYLNIVALRGVHRTHKPMAWALSLISNFLVGYTLALSLEQIENARSNPSVQR